MTVPIETSKTVYAGDGVATVFGTGFYFLAKSEVVVKLKLDGGTEVVQTLGVHYTIALPASVGSNGSVTMLTAPPALSVLTIERTVPYTQVTSFRTAGTFSRAVHEDAMDELAFQNQQNSRRLSALESAGAAGDVIAGNGLAFSGKTLHVGAGAGIQANADTVEVLYGAAADLADVAKSAEAAGVANTAARTDHKHDISTGVPVAGAVAIGNAAGEGTATSLARSDHQHAVAAPPAPADVTKAAAAAGTATTFARADHKHDITTANVATVTDATNAEGVATTLARADHTHGHGDRGGGTLHALVVAGGAAGFMSGADKTKLDGIAPEVIEIKEGKTLDATATLLMSWTPAGETAEIVDVQVVGLKTGGVATGGYHIRLTCRRFDGTTSIIAQERVVADQESDTAWDCVIGVVSPAINVTVTGVAATTIGWRGIVRRIIRAAA